MSVILILAAACAEQAAAHSHPPELRTSARTCLLLGRKFCCFLMSLGLAANFLASCASMEAATAELTKEEAMSATRAAPTMRRDTICGRRRTRERPPGDESKDG